MEHYSLSELKSHIENEDLHLTCTINIQVDVSMEKPYHYSKNNAENVILAQDKGWLVSLALQLPPSDSHPFSDGEPLMVCDLRYLSELCGAIQLNDIIRALAIDPNAKIWTLRPAS